MKYLDRLKLSFRQQVEHDVHKELVAPSYSPVYGQKPVRIYKPEGRAPRLHRSFRVEAVGHEASGRSTFQSYVQGCADQIRYGVVADKRFSGTAAREVLNYVNDMQDEILESIPPQMYAAYDLRRNALSLAVTDDHYFRDRNMPILGKRRQVGVVNAFETRDDSGSLAVAGETVLFSGFSPAGFD